uniref:Uncharacterized protein n=1 Tax=viral metagenome TaxID=1070528 RepID=A0A6C0EV93_9ZZZZ
MELNFTEIYNLDNTDNTRENTNNNTDIANKYWEDNPGINSKQKKKVKFSYDDILLSLNLSVNKDGVLQYMSTKNEVIEPQKIQTNNRNIQNQIKTTNISQVQNKNSYIFNKYFKDYKDPTIVEERQIPKTKEEYNKMLVEEHTKRIEAIKRIQQIKSTKMFFSNNMGTSTSQRVTNLNHIFRM